MYPINHQKREEKNKNNGKERRLLKNKRHARAITRYNAMCDSDKPIMQQFGKFEHKWILDEEIVLAFQIYYWCDGQIFLKSLLVKDAFVLKLLRVKLYDA